MPKGTSKTFFHNSERKIQAFWRGFSNLYRGGGGSVFILLPIFSQISPMKMKLFGHRVGFERTASKSATALVVLLNVDEILKYIYYGHISKEIK